MSVLCHLQDALLDTKILSRSAMLKGHSLNEKSVLCLYGGYFGVLTEWYCKQGAYVTAVDKDFSLYTGSCNNIVKEDVFKFLRYFKNNHVFVLDIDPFGDPLPALKLFLENGNSADFFAITNGMISKKRLARGARYIDNKLFISRFVEEVSELIEGNLVSLFVSERGNAFYAGFAKKRE